MGPCLPQNPPMPALRLLLIPAFAVSVCGLALAQTVTRSVLVINAADRPIFALRIGHADTGTWSDDLFGLTDVLGVHAGRTVALPIDESTCAYDLEATYPDGHASLLRNVDVCSTPRIVFDGS